MPNRRLRIHNDSAGLLELWLEPEGDCRILPPGTKLLLEEVDSLYGAREPPEVVWQPHRVTVWWGQSRVLVEEGKVIRDERDDEFRKPWPPPSLRGLPPS